MPGCDYTTQEDAGDAVAMAMLTIHSSTAHSAKDIVNPKVSQPKVCAGASSDKWQNFIHDWEMYKTMCGVWTAQVNTHLLECCEETLKHYMYSLYTPEQVGVASE